MCSLYAAVTGEEAPVNPQQSHSREVPRVNRPNSRAHERGEDNREA